MSLSALVGPQLPFRAATPGRSAGASERRRLCGGHAGSPGRRSQPVERAASLAWRPTGRFPASGTPLPFNAAEPPRAEPAERRLNGITPLAPPGFPADRGRRLHAEQAARVLECTPDDFSRLVAAAGCEISEQAPTDVLIVEDEPMIAMDLEYLVTASEISVAGNARTRGEAVEWRRLRPGLVLADIFSPTAAPGSKPSTTSSNPSMSP